MPALADGSNLPFRDNLFDIVLCSSSLVWFTDVPDTLREWARVTKPGGRLAFSCLAASAHPLGRLFRAHLAGYGVDFPDLNEPVNTAGKCRRLLGQTGYTNVVVRTGVESAFVPIHADVRQATGMSVEPDPEGGDRWETLRRHPMSLWARVRRGESIGIPLVPDELLRLEQDYRTEIAALSTERGIPNPLTTMFVTATLQDRG